MLRQVGLVAIMIFAAAASASAGGDAEAGKKVFNKCLACHNVGEGAVNKVGPALTTVVGRTAGMYPDFNYSTTNKNAGAQGLVWTEENIIAYLPDAAAFMKKFLTDKGKPELYIDPPKMLFKLADETQRADVVAYLKTFAK